MDQLTSILWGLNQDQAIVALFTIVLILCSVAACGALVLNALGGRGRTTLLFALAAVAIVWMLTRV